MDLISKTKKNLLKSQNILIFPSKNPPDSIPASLALFYTLKKLSKNVNLFLENFPKNLEFLTPSLDFISYPNQFIISIKDLEEDISQLYYEKDENNLKLFFKLKKGVIRKKDISFDWTWEKPDLIVTLGIKEQEEIGKFSKKIEKVPILNIDTQKKNKRFGKINLIDSDSTLTEIITKVIKSIDENLFEENISTCLLTGLALASENFSKPENLPQIFEKVAFLMKKNFLEKSN